MGDSAVQIQAFLFFSFSYFPFVSLAVFLSYPVHHPMPKGVLSREGGTFSIRRKAEEDVYFTFRPPPYEYSTPSITLAHQRLRSITANDDPDDSLLRYHGWGGSDGRRMRVLERLCSLNWIKL